MKKILVLMMIAGVLFTGCGNTSPKFSHPNNGVVKEPHGNRTAYMPYKNGKRNGIAKFYDKQGHLVAEVPFVDGKIHGVKKTWEYKGNKLTGYAVVPYKNGKEDGISKRYFANGKLHMISGEKDGRFHGVYKIYNKNGTLYDSGRFDHGKKVGTWTERFENGKLFATRTYTYTKDKEGKEHRTIYVKEYDKNGKVARRIVTRDGEEISHTLSPALKRQIAKEEREYAALEKREAAARRASSKQASSAAKAYLKCNDGGRMKSMSEIAAESASGEGAGKGYALAYRMSESKPLSPQEKYNFCTEGASSSYYSCNYAEAFRSGCLSGL